MTIRIAPLCVALSLALAARASLAQDGSTAFGRLEHARYGAPSSFGTTIDPLLGLELRLDGEHAPALELRGGAEGDPLLWLLGTAPANIDLGAGAHLLVDPTLLIAVPDVVRHEGPGLPIEATDVALHGLAVYAQAITLVSPSSGGGALLSDGRSLRLASLSATALPRKGAGVELVHLTEASDAATTHGLLAAVTIESPGYALELVSAQPVDGAYRIVLQVISPIVPSANRERATYFLPLGDSAYGPVEVHLADLIDGQYRDPKLVAELTLER